MLARKTNLLMARTPKDFFLFCAGIDRSILDQCPSDENKYVGIGATVFFTGVLAFCSASYALFTVFDTYWGALLFGLVWGAMIFNLDRYIVSSMKSRGSRWQNFSIALPRLLLAVLLALVISKPLELKIFEKEINAELLVMEQEVFKTQEDQIKLRYAPDLRNWQAEIATLKSEIETKERTRDDLALLALQEADGTGGSGNKNLGPIYRAKKKKADAAQQELTALLANHRPLIAEKEAQIQRTQTQVRDEIAALQRGSYGGLAARMEALDRLGRESQAIYFASIFITLLFIAIETAPIFVKLISSRSPYDYLLYRHEQVYELESLEDTTLRHNTVSNKLERAREVGQHETRAQVQLSKATIDERARRELEKLKRENWSTTGRFLHWD